MLNISKEFLDRLEKHKVEKKAVEEKYKEEIDKIKSQLISYKLNEQESNFYVDRFVIGKMQDSNFEFNVIEEVEKDLNTYPKHDANIMIMNLKANTVAFYDSDFKLIKSFKKIWSVKGDYRNAVKKLMIELNITEDNRSACDTINTFRLRKACIARLKELSNSPDFQERMKKVTECLKNEL